MRLLLIAATLFLLAGCSEPAPQTVETEPQPLPLAPLPLDMLVEATLEPSADPTPGIGVGVAESCEVTEVCHHYPFILGRTANVTLILRWAGFSNDLDVYVIDSAGVEVPPTPNGPSPIGPEAQRGLLPAGDYQVRVKGFLSTASPTPSLGTPYTLEVFFDEP